MRYLKNKLRDFILSILIPILDQHKRSIELMIEAKFDAMGTPAPSQTIPPQIDIRVDRKSARR